MNKNTCPKTLKNCQRESFLKSPKDKSQKRLLQSFFLPLFWLGDIAQPITGGISRIVFLEIVFFVHEDTPLHETLHPIVALRRVFCVVFDGM